MTTQRYSVLRYKLNPFTNELRMFKNEKIDTNLIVNYFKKDDIISNTSWEREKGLEQLFIDIKIDDATEDSGNGKNYDDWIMIEKIE